LQQDEGFFHRIAIDSILPEDQDRMKQAERIAINIGVTFFRMFTTIGIGLYATRLLVNALGEVDFGLFGAVAGGIAVMSVIQAALLQSSQRNLAYQIGKGDPEQLNAMFSSCFAIFLATAILLLTVGYFLTPFVLNYLQFPAEREATVKTLWAAMVLSLGVLSIRSIFHGLFMAHQALVQDAVFMVLASLMRLGIAITVSYHDGDRLLLYGWLFVLMGVIELIYMVLVALIRFPESRVRIHLIRFSDLRKLLSFGGWGIFDLLVLRLRQYGGNLILNPFFGPIANAGYSVAVQAQIYPSRVVMSISNATRPAIVQRYARGDIDFVRKMVLSTCRMGTLFTSLLIIPFLVEMDYLLKLWLVKVPAHAVDFCRFMFLAVLLEQLTGGFISAVQATGKIGKFTTISTITLCIPFLLATVSFVLGYRQPELMVQLLLVGICVAVLFQAWYVGSMIGIPFQEWFRQVVLRMLVAVGGSFLVAYCVRIGWGEESLQRCAVVTLSFFGSIACLGWLYGLTYLEKDKIRSWSHFAIRLIKRA